MTDEKAVEYKDSKLLETMAAISGKATVQIVLNKDEFPDKITWGKADFRKELRFNSSNLPEAEARLENYSKIMRKIEESEVKSNV